VDDDRELCGAGHGRAYLSGNNAAAVLTILTDLAAGRRKLAVADLKFEV
jgi:hypothetical protein